MLDIWKLTADERDAHTLNNEYYNTWMLISDYIMRQIQGLMHDS